MIILVFSKLCIKRKLEYDYPLVHPWLIQFLQFILKCFFLILLELGLSRKITDNHRSVLTETSFSSRRMDGNWGWLTWIQTLLDCDLRKLWIYGKFSFCCGEVVFWGCFRQPQRQDKGLGWKYGSDHWG